MPNIDGITTYLCYGYRIVYCSSTLSVCRLRHFNSLGRYRKHGAYAIIWYKNRKGRRKRVGKKLTKIRTEGMN
jgi:hypothetical protein